MLRLPRWLIYRDDVLKHLDTLLVMYPRRRQFTADFPGLRARIRQHFDEGAPATGAALAIAADVIDGLARQLDTAERAEAAGRLASIELDALKPIVARRLSRHPDPPGSANAFAAQLTGCAILMARGLVEEGQLAGREFEAFLEALDGTFGLARSERALTRRFALPERPTLWTGQGG